MPKIVNISTEYRNALKNNSDFSANPSDFTENYTGVIMERTQAKILASVEWYANSDLTDTWNVDATNFIITRTIGDFEADGFRVGQKFIFISDWSGDNSTPQEFEGVIAFIRDNGLRLDFTLTLGVITSTGTQANVGIRAKGNAPENYLTGIVYRFGFVENSAAPDFTSLVTGNNQGYQAGGITRVVNDVDLNPIGTLKDWVTGSALITFVSESDFTQVFEISHNFVVHPWYREGENINIPPSEFEGTNSLKHVFDLDFRQVLSNPNTSISGSLTDSLGSVGFFNENFNGLGDDYNIVSIDYEDTASTLAVGALQAGLRTTVTIEIKKVSGAILATQKAGLFVSLLAPQSEYQDKETTLLDNFIYDNLYHVEGTPVDIGPNVIKSLNSSISGGNLIIVAELEYSSVQQSTLSSLSSPNYVLGVNIANELLTNANSDRLTLLADTRPYIVSGDVSGLINFDKFDLHFGESNIGVDAGFTDFEGWIEDSLAIEFNFTLERDVLKDAVLNTIEFALVAYKDSTGELFYLDRTNINLSSIVVSGGIQQIEIDNNRNYLFVDGNQYKEISIETGALVGTLQNYSGVFAQKIRWEDWLINREADTVFYDNTQPNNGLNFKSSNYSGLEGYTIRLAVNANVQGLNDLGVSVATDYRILSNDLLISDYNVGNGYTCVIELFRLSNLSLVNRVLSGEDTLVRATFTADSGAITDLTGFWSAIKMQRDNDAGQQIAELSINYIDSSGMLKPKNGLSFLDMFLDSGNVVSECVIDGSKVGNFNYNISARLKALEDECFVEFMNGDCVEFMNGDLAKFQNQ